MRIKGGSQFRIHAGCCHVRLLVIQRTEASQATLSFTNSCSLLKLMSVELVMPSNHLILSCPLLLHCPLLPPSIFSSIRIFSNESALCIRCPKYWSFSFSISPSNDYLGLIFSRMDWFGHLACRNRDLCFILQMPKKFPAHSRCSVYDS